MAVIQQEVCEAAAGVTAPGSDGQAAQADSSAAPATSATAATSAAPATSASPAASATPAFPASKGKGSGGKAKGWMVHLEITCT